MNYFIKSIIVIGFFLCCSACLNFPDIGKPEKLSLEGDFMVVPIKNQYSIAIPNYMKPATNLNDEASLQYQNIFKEAYLVVIDEPKEDFVNSFKEIGEWDESLSITQNYMSIQMQYLHEEMEIKNVTDIDSRTVSGLKTNLVDFEGKMPEIFYPIGYKMACVEGKKDIYLIMTWTLKSKKEKLDNTYLQIINSFKEL